MKSPITLSDFVSSENDLETFALIATRFVDLDGNEIYLSFEDGWYTDDAVCCSDLFDAGLDVMVLTIFYYTKSTRPFTSSSTALAIELET